MARNVYKYILTGDATQEIEVPPGVKPLTVQMQHGKICLWCEVDSGLVDEGACTNAAVFLVGTGREVPTKARIYIGTVQMANEVWHVYGTLFFSAGR